jgi:hypothetical protein
MADLTAAEIAAARERGRLYRATEPHAASARYDAGSDRIVVELTSRDTFAFPPSVAEGLAGATSDQLADIELLGHGSGLHWEQLDVDYAVPGLVNGVFGIHTDDHEPAHVHMFGDGEMKIVIAAGDGLPLAVWSIGMKRAHKRSAMDVALERQAEFLARWQKIQGGRG